MLLFERHHDFGVLFDSLGTGGDGSYLGAFLAAALLGLYLFYGFEACGDVAEEVPDPGTTIPQAMRRTIYIGGAAGLLITAALMLAQPDFNAILSGAQADPVGAVLSDVFGTVGSKIITVIVLISFVSCVLSLQAAASRYIAFQLVVLAALIARSRGWIPRGKFTLGAWGLPVNIVALVYGVGGALNLAWPRGGPDVAWTDKWIVVIGCAIVVGSGLLYMLVGRPYARGTSPAGDAVTAG